ncbi:MAG TPA: ABC transporter substrate-binding protein [Anaerolineales bacterium]|nr:ABC transporter substrate-binding protein [Anaerolineales bacterium]
MKNRYIITLLLALSIVLSACAAPTVTQAPAEPAPAEAELTEVSAPEPTVPSAPEPTEEPLAEPVILRLGAKCGPSPHAMPFLVLMAQTGGTLPSGTQIEFVPITEPSQMAALLNSGEVDAMLGFIAQTANIYKKGGVDNLRLLDILLWKGFYVVAPEGVKSWEDLQGKKILMPDPQSGPSQLVITSMRQAGFDPEIDFTVENLPASQIVQMMISGKADAAVFSEPFATITMSKAKKEGGTPLKIAPIDLYSVYQADAWDAGQAPINGLLTLQEVLDDPVLSTSLFEIETLYIEAVEFMLSNPDEASQLIVGQLGEFCDSKMEAKPISKAIQSGRMVYGVTPVEELLPDLDAYIEEIIQNEIDDAFYAKR